MSDERQRQIEKEMFTASHDSMHSRGELAIVAACYAMPYRGFLNTDHWPKTWDRRWWKPKSRMRDLVRAGALIAAEIDRIQATEGLVK
jgi:hypothetical protein